MSLVSRSLSPVGVRIACCASLVACLWLPLLGAQTALALSCHHPAGHLAVSLWGDVNDSGSTNVADVVCLVKAALATTAGQPLSTVACLAAEHQKADLTCDGAVNIGDVTTSVHLSIGLGVPSALAPDGSGCPLACTPCANPGESSCLIGGVCVLEGARIGADGCQVCDPASDVWHHTADTCVSHYRDNDGDTYGVLSDAQCRCAPSSPYTALAPGDCNDADASIHPGASELCDIIDNDCNGPTDEAFTTLGDACDGPDGDLCENGTTECASGGATTACSTETIENIQEICNDDDDDCDGRTDETFLTLGSACDGPDSDGCAYGVLVCTGDGAGVECGPESPSGVTEICGNGIDDDCDSVTDEGCSGTAAPLPNTITNLRAWYRADSLALADNAAVTTWSDESGQGFHLTGVTGSPRLRTGIINSKPIVRFDGASGLNTSNIVLQGGATDFTVFLVVRAGTSQNVHADMYDNSHGSNTAGPMIQQSGTNLNVYASAWWNGSSYSGTSTFTVSSAAFQIHHTHKAGATVRHFINGGLATNNSVPANMAQPSVPLYVGRGNIGGRSWNGDMAELVYFNRALSDAEQQQMKFYLAQKYAVSGPNLALRSCADLAAGAASGVYPVDPNLDGSGFDVYCDQTDGGGWTKILQYANSAYTPTAAAAGTIATPTISGFAKLSDAHINELRSLWATPTYRLFGADPGNSNKKAYIKSAQTFADTTIGWGFAKGSLTACTATSLAGCGGFSSISSTYLDTLTWGIASNDCGRYFADYPGSSVNCYSGPGAGSGVRCVNSGHTCGNHQQRTDFSIAIRP